MLSLPDSLNQRPRNAKFVGYFSVPSWISFDTGHLRRSQFVGGNFLSASSTVFGISIFYVFQFSAQYQVVRTDTAWGIASVPDHQSERDAATVVEHPGKSMRLPLFSLVPEEAITLLGLRRSP